MILAAFSDRRKDSVCGRGSPTVDWLATAIPLQEAVGFALAPKESAAMSARVYGISGRV